MNVLLLPFRPDSNCSACDGEDILLVFHRGAVLGSWPCGSRTEPGDRIHEPHLCKRCTRCGYAWAEAPASAAAYAEENPEEDAMSLRKTAAAGKVLGVEDEGEGEGEPLVKTAAVADPSWRAEDEQALAAENVVADQS